MVAAVLVVVALFTLGNPGTPKLSQEPPSFDGEAAYADLKTIVEDFPQRVAGSDPDNRMGIWVEQQFRAAGLETHIDGFAATVNGKDVALQNVWGVAKGRTQGTIMILANRDVPPLATQGAGDNASGVAAMLALADAFTVTAHEHTLIFLCTTGDAYGALGAHEFVAAHQTDDLYAVIALRDVAKRDSDGVGLDGWSSVPKTAPPWLWLLTAPAAKRDSNMDAELPTVPAQVLRLAVPTGAGSQGPFVAAGVPAITVSAAGPSTPAQNDTLDTVSQDTLTEVGTAAQNMVMAVDGTTEPGRAERRHDLPHPQGDAAGRRARRHPRRPAPAARRRHRRPVRPLPPDPHPPAPRLRARRPAPRPVARADRHRLLRQPRRPAAAQPGRGHPSGLAPRRRPRATCAWSCSSRSWLLAYAYAVAVERRLERRFATDARATIFVSHLLLVLIALLLLLVNPYAVLLVLPGAVLWPLARPGGWARSILPVYLGLLMVPVPLIYYALQLDIGLEGLVVLLPALREPDRSRRPRCCWRRCSSRRPACSRTRCTSAASRRGRSRGRPWTAAARTA